MIFCKKKPKFTWKNYLTLFFLFAFSLLLIRFLVPSGSYFGSRIDWYSQHLTIADYMRKQFFATGNLFPDFTGLGGGTNFFSLSYYGFMRPDILVSYLFISSRDTRSWESLWEVPFFIIGSSKRAFPTLPALPLLFCI